MIYIHNFQFERSNDLPTERLMIALFPHFLSDYYRGGPELESMMEDYYKRIQRLVAQGCKFEELKTAAPALVEEIRRAARERCVFSVESYYILIYTQTGRAPV